MEIYGPKSLAVLYSREISKCFFFKTIHTTIATKVLLRGKGPINTPPHIIVKAATITQLIITGKNPSHITNLTNLSSTP